ncbi:hypothetical protein GCK72_009347 [Caenorhabditis remanei]|uniref:Uncharacterized protein n=1 Tax=Caenorhabditis remanei TaxID=31234 RepID=A0A6A5H3I6_CAERE|nr:hypothetical protein GCK72_009347 [Caenorhabditis remanei]KAF1761093.1 hypothetical protein GCK72_009347 [Caenorhabditis remanei]
MKFQNVHIAHTDEEDKEKLLPLNKDDLKDEKGITIIKISEKLKIYKLIRNSLKPPTEHLHVISSNTNTFAPWQELDLTYFKWIVFHLDC